MIMPRVEDSERDRTAYYAAYYRRNKHRWPLRPYVRTPEQRAAYNERMRLYRLENKDAISLGRALGVGIAAARLLIARAALACLLPRPASAPPAPPPKAPGTPAPGPAKRSSGLPRAGEEQNRPFGPSGRGSSGATPETNG